MGVKGPVLVLPCGMAVNCAHRLCKACLASHGAEQHGWGRRLALVLLITQPVAPCAGGLLISPMAGCTGVAACWILSSDSGSSRMGGAWLGAALLGLEFLFFFNFWFVSAPFPPAIVTAGSWFFINSTPLEGNVVWHGKGREPARKWHNMHVVGVMAVGHLGHWPGVRLSKGLGSSLSGSPALG